MSIGEELVLDGAELEKKVDAYLHGTHHLAGQAYEMLSKSLTKELQAQIDQVNPSTIVMTNLDILVSGRYSVFLHPISAVLAELIDKNKADGRMVVARASDTSKLPWNLVARIDRVE